MPVPPQIIGRVVSGMRGSCTIKRQGQSALSWGRGQCHRSSPDKWEIQEGEKERRRWPVQVEGAAWARSLKPLRQQDMYRHCVYRGECRVRRCQGLTDCSSPSVEA